MVSMQTASAQYLYWTPWWYWQPDPYWGTNAAENDLADAKARRDKTRKERELTGKSDHGARLRLESECTRSLERGVDNDVLRSYGCYN
jgi:hypothetical protein